MKFSTLVLIFLFATVSSAQDKKPYQIFDSKGKKTSYEKLLKSAQKNKVVLFGELHDYSIIHWLELEFTKDLSQKGPLTLGAEMIETDNQSQLNNYLSGRFNQVELDSTARLWLNYKTDYKPLVDFAKEKNLTFIATNVPRRYASLVFKKGLEELKNLTPEEKRLMAPLPIEYDAELPGYKAMLEMKNGATAGDKLPKAQALKDATMAYFILKNLKDDHIFLHFNGTYHSENYEGINWYLRSREPEIKILTIATVEQKDLATLEKEYYNKADFIIVIDDDVTKTH
jgi:uncharacterized iron-regulated protein